MPLSRAQLKSFLRTVIKVVPGGSPSERTRGAALINVFDQILEAAILQEDGGAGGGGSIDLEGITEFRDRFQAEFKGDLQKFATTLLIKYQAPGFGGLTLGGQGDQDVPVGSFFSAGFKSFGWSTTNAANIKPNSISLQDVTTGANLATDQADDGTLSASTAAFTAGRGESRRYRISAVNTQGATFSRDLVIRGHGQSFYGYSSAESLTAAGLLALGNAALQDGRVRTIEGVTAKQNEYFYYAYEASAGDLTGVIMDGAEPILGAFRKLSDQSGTNDYGADITLRVYRSNAPGAFGNNQLAIA